ncbi:hypothetical protein ROLI_028940 [Roseobacter fucihabitans]|uniref:DUF2937 family protein n=1 Tax=Roseobacter fucihabitans TaxID=1537242 RepID=A0ABZ2BUR8_9RHOB|nr:DUF2937 family protein [Roseobacter litoralis]MBC6964812.1 hypothetical protein [Roseobacter litoralis]
MILRAVTLAAGLAGGFGAAQFPAYSQQYMQRLGGAVDALQQVVSDFDTSAKAEGLTRGGALSQMQGSAFVERRRADMTRTIDRYDRLRADLAVLQGQGPFMRAYHGARFTDPEIAARAWQAFQPALPLSVTSVIFAGVGFAVSAGGLRAILAVSRLRRRRKPMAA